MRKGILADYERDFFREEVRLRPGQEHSKVCGTERLGFAKLDQYLNAKPKSVKPIRLVGVRAAAEQDMVKIFWLVARLSRVLPPSGRPTVSSCPRRRKENGSSLWITANLMRPPCRTRTPSPSLKILNR